MRQNNNDTLKEPMMITKNDGDATSICTKTRIDGQQIASTEYLSHRSYLKLQQSSRGSRKTRKTTESNENLAKARTWNETLESDKIYQR